MSGNGPRLPNPGAKGRLKATTRAKKVSPGMKRGLLWHALPLEERRGRFYVPATLTCRALVDRSLLTHETHGELTDAGKTTLRELGLLDEGGLLTAAGRETVGPRSR